MIHADYATTWGPFIGFAPTRAEQAIDTPPKDREAVVRITDVHTGMARYYKVVGGRSAERIRP